MPDKPHVQLELPLDTSEPLPGFELLDVWAKRAGDPSPYTLRRWEKSGQIIVRRIGRERFIDKVATAAAARGERPRKRGRPPKQPQPDPRQINIADLLAE